MCQSDWQCQCQELLGMGSVMATPPWMSDIVNQVATAAALVQ